MAYYPGQSARFSVTATLLGALVNPPSVVLTLRSSIDETIITPAVVNDSTGNYHADVAFPITAKPGPWSVRWVASGGGPSQTGLVEYQIQVQALLY